MRGGVVSAVWGRVSRFAPKTWVTVWLFVLFCLGSGRGASFIEAVSVSSGCAGTSIAHKGCSDTLAPAYRSSISYKPS